MLKSDVGGTSRNDGSQALCCHPLTYRYKTQEEYHREILELKKILKHLQSNEVIAKTKMEYYENELAKKEQEILDLLDVKKAEELRLSAESKTDLASVSCFFFVSNDFLASAKEFKS